MAGIEETPENVWEDEDYYYILCEISNLSYHTDDIQELANYIKQLFWSYKKIKVEDGLCRETAGKILESRA